MAQITHGKNDEMCVKKESILTIEPYQQSPEFIYPSVRSCLALSNILGKSQLFVTNIIYERLVYAPILHMTDRSCASVYRFVHLPSSDAPQP